MTPKLYQYAVCPFCKKIDAILKYKKVHFEAVEVHPLNKKEISFSEYKKVPIYIDSKGDQINDSTPIMQHIDKEFPHDPVFTGDEEEKKWLDWSGSLVKALPPLIYSSYGDALKAFNYITKVGKFSFIQRIFVKYSGAFAMYLVAKKSAKKQEITNPTEHFKTTLKELESGLEGKKFLGGDKPNGADLANYGILQSIENLPAQQLIKENKAVSTWYDNLQGTLCQS